MKSVLDWPTSKNIQKFLGLANYYQQFIKDFIVIARPLYNLVKKYHKWIFKKLKKKFTKKLVLAVLVASNSYLDFSLNSIDSSCVSMPMRGGFSLLRPKVSTTCSR